MQTKGSADAYSACRADIAVSLERTMTVTQPTTRPWDSAEQLLTDDDIAEYFDACLQQGADDPAFIAHALGVIARARGMAQVARDSGLSREGFMKRCPKTATRASARY